MKRIVINLLDVIAYQFNDLDKEAQDKAKDQVRKQCIGNTPTKGYDSFGDYIQENFFFYADGEMMTIKNPVSQRLLMALDKDIIIEDV